MYVNSESPREGDDPVVESETRIRLLSFTAIRLQTQPGWVQAPIASFMEDRQGGQVVYSSVAFSYVSAVSPDSELTPTEGLRDLRAFKAGSASRELGQVEVLKSLAKTSFCAKPLL